MHGYSGDIKCWSVCREEKSCMSTYQQLCYPLPQDWQDHSYSRGLGGSVWLDTRTVIFWRSLFNKLSSRVIVCGCYRCCVRIWWYSALGFLLVLLAGHCCGQKSHVPGGTLIIYTSFYLLLFVPLDIMIEKNILTHSPIVITDQCN